LPRLTPDQIAQLGKSIESLPDPRKSLVKALKVGIANFAREADATLPKEQNELDKAVMPKRYSRQIKKRLPWVIHDIKALENWIQSGGNEAVPERSKKLKSSPFWIDTASLMRTAQKAYALRTTTLTAMDAELLRRAQPYPLEVALPYNGNRKIVLKEGFGCVEKGE
jgi:hypothetical protein